MRGSRRADRFQPSKNHKFAVSLLQLGNQLAKGSADIFDMGMKVLVRIDRAAGNHLSRKHDCRHGLHRARFHPLGDLSKLGGAFVTAVSSIADEHKGLSGPFLVEMINRVLQGGRVSPIVLRRDKHESVCAGDLAAPSAGM